MIEKVFTFSEKVRNKHFAKSALYCHPEWCSACTNITHFIACMLYGRGWFIPPFIKRFVCEAPLGRPLGGGFSLDYSRWLLSAPPAAAWHSLQGTSELKVSEGDKRIREADRRVVCVCSLAASDVERWHGESHPWTNVFTETQESLLQSPSLETCPLPLLYISQASDVFT